MNKNDVAKLIDHTILVPTATRDDIKKVCAEAKEYNFQSVCVNSYWVKRAAKELKDSEVKVCSVVGFPLGAMSTEAKSFEAVQAIKDGADEIDIVMNIGLAKSGDWDKVKQDLIRVTHAIKVRKPYAIVKVIIETCLLTDEEKIKAVKAVKKAGADFSKTSTGFSTGGATVEDVKLMKANGVYNVKASGGVRNLATVEEMVKAGATRIGTSNGVAIMQEFDNVVNEENTAY